MATLDGDSLERATAKKLQWLATAAGISATIEWDGAQYVANGEGCGRSVHGVYAWIEKKKTEKD